MIPEQCYEDLDHHDYSFLFNTPDTDYFDSIERTYSTAERETIIRNQARSLNELIDELKSCGPEMSQESLPEKISELDVLIKDLGVIRNLKPLLSAAQVQRLENLMIDDIHFCLRTIVDTKSLWREADGNGLWHNGEKVELK
jgi:hypothetical protein|tara:strand:- start:40 stop:465 length:426 start_codon:yes stop_codon:yes gene_type:complete